MSERITASRRNIPSKRCGVYQQVLHRKDAVGGEYADGFRRFAVRLREAKPVPAYVEHTARRVGLQPSRPEPDVWMFAEAEP